MWLRQFRGDHERQPLIDRIGKPPEGLKIDEILGLLESSSPLIDLRQVDPSPRFPRGGGWWTGEVCLKSIGDSYAVAGDW